MCNQSRRHALPMVYPRCHLRLFIHGATRSLKWTESCPPFKCPLSHFGPANAAKKMSFASLQKPLQNGWSSSTKFCESPFIVLDHQKCDGRDSRFNLKILYPERARLLSRQIFIKCFYFSTQTVNKNTHEEFQLSSLDLESLNSTHGWFEKDSWILLDLGGFTLIYRCIKRSGMERRHGRLRHHKSNGFQALFTSIALHERPTCKSIADSYFIP